MAKSKNHSTHHRNSKEHRNGIKKPVVHAKTSSKGLDTKFARNQRYARIGVKPERYVRGDMQEQKPHKNPRKSVKQILADLKAKQGK
ncbi:S60 ribosomal protein L29 [Heterostelium album PN500]|uniref:60S ribosomal protein L29 n=1 Tax=Heterostelium pallidum (strain ATCC 26659 / Pp 5 / PN500) TaxID=670386 RepID=D3BJI3_HETP5|nr:S60 ribosomal protein L29 [Heterostelium album PN500]EFA78063.1 S60 ribosomal protein L29 [Heterostelium album PN500]|eukprot:XP_020430190.1 S60 ribosomal protein L29 [Heterostelium album PN500]